MKLRAKFESGSSATEPTKRTQSSTEASVSPAARNLALAHHLNGLIERGLITDYTAAARMLEVSQPRLTHLMGLLMLAPDLQAAILLGELAFGDKELRALARLADWDEQKAMVANRNTRHRVRPVGC